MIFSVLVPLLVALQVSAKTQPLHKRVELVRKAGAEAGVLAGAPVNNVTVQTYNVDQCGQATIVWTGTTAPVSLKIGQGGFYVGITEITTLNDLYDDYTMWTVDQPEGEDLIFQVTDANGEVGYVQNVKVGGGDGWCLGGSTESVTATSDYDTGSGSATNSITYAAVGGDVTSSATATTLQTSSKKSRSSTVSATTTIKASAIGSNPRISNSATSNPTSTSITQDDTAAIITSASGSSYSGSAVPLVVSASTNHTSSRHSASGSAGASASLAGANSAAQTGSAGRRHLAGHGVLGLLGCALIASLLL